MTKTFLKFAAVLLVGSSMFGFKGCVPEVTITAPSDITIDLGQELGDPMLGLIVEGAKEEDVQVLWNPSFNNNLVNEYVATYVVEGVSDTRSVFVRSNLLAGTYSVSDVVPGQAPINYIVTVTQSAEKFNRILIDAFGDFEIVVHADIVGNAITIPQQTPTGWDARESVVGTGTYDGPGKRLLTFSYTIRYLVNNVIVTDTGVATYTRR